MFKLPKPLGLARSAVESGDLDFNSIPCQTEFEGVLPEFWYSDYNSNTFHVEYSVRGYWIVTKNNSYTSIIVPSRCYVDGPLIDILYANLEAQGFDYSLPVDLITKKELPKVIMSSKLKKKLAKKSGGKLINNPTRKSSKKKNNNLENNNLLDPLYDTDPSILETEYKGKSLGKYLDDEYPLFTPTSLSTEELLAVRHCQYNSILTACKMDPKGAKKQELLILGRLRQIALDIAALNGILTIRQDIRDTLESE